MAYLAQNTEASPAPLASRRGRDGAGAALAGRRVFNESMPA